MSVTPATGGAGRGAPQRRIRAGARKGVPRRRPRLPPGPLRGGRGSRVRPVGRGLPAVGGRSPDWPGDRFGGGACPAGGSSEPLPVPPSAGSKCVRSTARPPSSEPHPGASARVAGAGGGAGAEGRAAPSREAAALRTGAIVGAGWCPQGQARSAPAASGAVVPGSAPARPSIRRPVPDRWHPPPPRRSAARPVPARPRGGCRAVAHRRLRLGARPEPGVPSPPARRPGAGPRGAGGLRPCRAGDRLDDRLPGRRPLRGDRWGLRPRWSASVAAARPVPRWGRPPGAGSGGEVGGSWARRRGDRRARPARGVPVAMGGGAGGKRPSRLRRGGRPLLAPRRGTNGPRRPRQVDAAVPGGLGAGSTGAGGVAGLPVRASSMAAAGRRAGRGLSSPASSPRSASSELTSDRKTSRLREPAVERLFAMVPTYPRIGAIWGAVYDV